ncbi:hypothetical protein K438DRAFT_1755457 [Mycena galopus ATCC 62051]|nr:hypothetical protein K438DRAFT_1755457 [Mycena galopus ATCC 62051]
MRVVPGEMQVTAAATYMMNTLSGMHEVLIGRGEEEAGVLVVEFGWRGEQRRSRRGRGQGRGGRARWSSQREKETQEETHKRERQLVVTPIARFLVTVGTEAMDCRRRWRGVVAPVKSTIDVAHDDGARTRDLIAS